MYQSTVYGPKRSIIVNILEHALFIFYEQELGINLGQNKYMLNGNIFGFVLYFNSI